ncbi:transcriptional regulator [Hoyosella sp. YIM 151337]|uniref:transcriptional regulator n=1 Tax=Hoyosella sp. YIM 151337 TaxID=2992742 RepID=UPI002236370E|nr:transcriptional regulator [Hoyosella sp. YIM 151337]MCW4352128.1 transcriptional regulator [Hoyosella sp. YIM 151337]
MAQPTRSPRLALIIFVIVGAAACLALGWWQLQRYESAAGSAQNLGYALQWPLFAGFLVYAYVKFVRLERQEERGELNDDQPKEIPEDLLPARPSRPAAADVDPETAAYNQYLAELANESGGQPSSPHNRDRSTRDI